MITQARFSVFRAAFAISIAGLLLATSCAAEAPQNDPQSYVITGAQDVPLVVQEWGNPDGIPVILIHGFSFGAVSFKNQIGSITSDLRLIAPDLRGHGLSAKPWTPDAYNSSKVWADDLKAIMDELEIKKPILVGWSFGGFVIMNYLRHYETQSVSGVILTGSLAGLTDRPPPPEPDDNDMPPPKGDGRADNYHDLFMNIDWLARIMTQEAPSRHVQTQKMMTLAMTPPLVKRAMAGMPLDNRDLAETLDIPILLIHGDKDGSIPSDYVQKAVKVLPNAASKLYAGGVGHSAFEERPEQFNQDLLKFAKRYAKSSP